MKPHIEYIGADDADCYKRGGDIYCGPCGRRELQAQSLDERGNPDDGWVVLASSREWTESPGATGVVHCDRCGKVMLGGEDFDQSILDELLETAYEAGKVDGAAMAYDTRPTEF